MPVRDDNEVTQYLPLKAETQRPLPVYPRPAGREEKREMVITTRNSTLALRALTIVVLATIIGGNGDAQQQLPPKDHYKKGERLLKQDLVYEAFEEFNQAARLDPNDKKYQRKMSEVGKVASVRVEAEANQQLNVNPVKAEALLKRSVEYDQANSTAVELLTKVRNSIDAARGKLSAAHLALDVGDLKRVEETIKSLEVYREALTLTLPALETELTAARRANAAEALWDTRHDEAPLEELSRAEREAPSSVFVRAVSKRLRREISNDTASKAAGLPKDNPGQVLEKLKMVSGAIEVDGTNERALELANQTSSALADVLLGQRRLFVVRDAPSSRIALEALRTAEPWLRGDARLADEKRKLESLAYPALRARVVIADLTGCSPFLTRDNLAQTLREALGGTVGVSGEQADIVVAVKRMTCSSTDIHRQKSEAINSTYVAARNQLLNPEYAMVEQQLSAAQQNYNRALILYQDNRSLTNTYLVGQLGRQVQTLQRSLAATPPYKTSEIVQQYQYEKFEAFRSYQIESTIQVFSKVAARQFTVERKVSCVGDDHSDGVAGVLPEDTSRY